MSADRYKIIGQHDIHFLTFTIMDWVDIFTRPDYKYIITDSLNFCIKEKELECFAWVSMTNHMHLVARAHPPFHLSDIIRDFKKFTSKKIIRTIQEIPESRAEWLLHRFQYSAYSTGRAEEYKLWQDGSRPVCLEGDQVRFKQRVDYIHQNPVKQMIVANAQDYLFSSAGDYCGRQGLVKVTVAY